MNVIGYGEIEFAVAVVIDEGAAGAPFFTGAGDFSLFCHFFESAVSFVVEEAVFAIPRYVYVVVAVIVIIADADALSPAGGGKTCFFGNVGECAVVVVMEEMVSRGSSRIRFVAGHRRSVHNEDIGPAVIVVVEDGDAGTGGFDDVALGVDTAVNVADHDSGLRCDVDEPCRRSVIGCGGVDGLGRLGGLRPSA